MTAWEINLGLIPGILFGVRQYEDIENNKIDHVLYMGCVDICLTLYYNEE